MGYLSLCKKCRYFRQKESFDVFSKREITPCLNRVVYIYTKLSKSIGNIWNFTAISTMDLPKGPPPFRSFTGDIPITHATRILTRYPPWAFKFPRNCHRDADADTPSHFLGFDPSAGPTKPLRSIVSTTRAARL